MEAGVKVRDNDEELKNKKPVMLFGRDIRKIPCFRNSFLYGISGGIVGGLICFMATSKVRLSSHVAFGSTWVIVFGYWFPCRYKNETTEITVQRWKEQMKDSYDQVEEKTES